MKECGPLGACCGPLASTNAVSTCCTHAAVDFFLGMPCEDKSSAWNKAGDVITHAADIARGALAIYDGIMFFVRLFRSTKK